MRFNKFRLSFLLVLISLSSFSVAGIFRSDVENIKNPDSTNFVSPFDAANNRCFKCHGQAKYEYTNETLGKTVKALMFTERIIKKSGFYNSNHKNFSCTDCHSEGYTKFPHPGELRMEQKYNCLDCHGGDEKYARYHFEEIDSAYRQSIHFKLEDEGFTCWKCHDPHSYKISVRNKDNLKETIAYDNAICLNCHSDFNHFQLLTDKAEINILEKHDWLPNQTSHFASVRCIECHTKINNKIPVSHLIKPKAEAVKLCNECHSQNSILMASLYKFESKARRRDGFFNGIILNESYVIGANRNAYLNLLSLIIFLAVIGVIAIHILFRIRKNNNTY
jgi:predicted CXXCH cytochrome family protein